MIAIARREQAHVADAQHRARIRHEPHRTFTACAGSVVVVERQKPRAFQGQSRQRAQGHDRADFVEAVGREHRQHRLPRQPQRRMRMQVFDGQAERLPRCHVCPQPRIGEAPRVGIEDCAARKHERVFDVGAGVQPQVSV